MGEKIAVAAGTIAALAATASSAGAAILVDQVPNGSFTVASAFSFDSPNDAQDSRAADDFVVPSGQVWVLQAADGFGFAQLGSPGTDTGAVTVYADGGQTPGATLFDQRGIALNGASCSPPSQCDFSAPLANGPRLEPGTYWVSIQAIAGDYGWAWAVNPPEFVYGAPAVWQNPGGAFSSACPGYEPLLDCGVTTAEHGKDLYLRLNGDLIDSRFSLGGFSSRGQRISLQANFPDPGQADVKGKKVKQASKSVGRGSAKLPIKLTKGAKRKLANGRKVKLSVKVTFTATGGVPFSNTAKVKLVPVRSAAGAPAFRLSR